MVPNKTQEKTYNIDPLGIEEIDQVVFLRHKELLELIPDSFDGAIEQDVFAMNETFGKHITKGIKDDDVFVAKATIDSQIVSIGAVSIIDFPPTPENYLGKAGYIHTMYTLPEHRRKGLSRQILDCLVDWCKNKGLKLILLAASDEGMKLYSSRGFRVWNTWMYLEPDGKGGGDETENCNCR